MHLPIEMDVMRALGKGADIEKAFKELEHRGGHPSAVKEGRVVYASYLIDENRVQEAWDLVRLLVSKPVATMPIAACGTWPPELPPCWVTSAPPVSCGTQSSWMIPDSPASTNSRR